MPLITYASCREAMEDGWAFSLWLSDLWSQSVNGDRFEYKNNQNINPTTLMVNDIPMPAIKSNLLQKYNKLN